MPDKFTYTDPIMPPGKALGLLMLGIVIVLVIRLAVNA